MTGEEPRMPRDEDVRQAWHAASDESPPSRVDAAILAAARDAAQRPAHGDGARRPRPWYREWQPMLAAAAIAGLAFALVQTMPSDDRVAMPLGAPASTGARPESSAPAMAQARQAPPATTGQAAEAAAEQTAEQPARDDASPAPPTQAPVVADSAAQSESLYAQPDSKSAAKSAAGVEEPIAPSAPAAAPAPAPARDIAGSLMAAPPAAVASRERAEPRADKKEIDAGQQAGAVQVAVDARIEHIVTLYRSGDKTGAATELRALRANAEGVDARLPPDLQDWARAVH